MNLKRKCQVVMLLTNENFINVGRLILGDGDYLFMTKEQGDKSFLKPQHLYILSDDEIKEGDWFYNKLLNNIFQCVEVLKDDLSNHIHFRDESGSRVVDINYCKKVIATTDKSLKLKETLFENVVIKKEWINKPLPEPSPQFIQKYIEEWNKGNKIEYVNVEYEAIGNWRHAEFIHTKDIPKVDKNNYITITKVKDSWNKEEVIEFAKKVERLINENKSTYTDIPERFIEENL